MPQPTKLYVDESGQPMDHAAGRELEGQQPVQPQPVQQPGNMAMSRPAGYPRDVGGGVAADDDNDPYSDSGLDRFMQQFWSKTGGNPFEMDVDAKLREIEAAELPRLLNAMSGGQVSWNRRNRMTKSEQARFNKAARHLSGSLRKTLEKEKSDSIRKTMFMWQMGKYKQQQAGARRAKEQTRLDKFRTHMDKVVAGRRKRMEEAMGRAIELTESDKLESGRLRKKAERNNDLINNYDPGDPGGDRMLRVGNSSQPAPNKEAYDRARKENREIYYHLDTYYDMSNREREVRGENAAGVGAKGGGSGAGAAATGGGPAGPGTGEQPKPGDADAKTKGKGKGPAAAEPTQLPPGVKQYGNAYSWQDPQSGQMYASDDPTKLGAIIEGRDRMGEGGDSSISTGASASAMSPPKGKRLLLPDGSDAIDRIRELAKRKSPDVPKLVAALKAKYSGPEYADAMRDLEDVAKYADVEL